MRNIFLGIILVLLISSQEVILGKELGHTSENSATFVQQSAKDLAEKSLILFLEAKFNEAFTIADQAIALDDKTALAYAIRGRMFMLRSEDEKAKNDLIQAATLEPTNPFVRAMFAWYLFSTERQNPETAKFAQDEANIIIRLLRQPKTVREYYLRSLAYSIVGNDAEALEDLTEIISSAPIYALIYKRRGDIYYSQSKNDLALADYNQAIKLNPKYSYAYQRRGWVYFYQKQTQLPLPEFEKAIEVDPTNGEAYYGKGSFHYELKQYDLALAEYTKAIEFDPKHSNAYNDRGTVYQYQKNQASLALNDYNNALSLNPFNKYAYNNIGNLQENAQLYDKAVETFTKLILIDPKFNGAYVKRGKNYLNLNMIDLALADFNKAIAQNPNDIDAYFHRGRAYFNLDQFDLAIASYTKAIEIDPKASGVFYNRGLIYYEQKHRFDLAEPDFSKTIELDPQNAGAFAVRADLYESMGKDNLADNDRKKFKSLGGTALPGFQNRRRTLYPNSFFDTNLTAAALETGTSTIVGKACVYKKTGRFTASNVRVVLFPVTPYFQQWYDLRERKESKSTGVFLSNEAVKYSIVTTANDNGEFVFSNLKPGKYFAQMIFNFTERRSGRVYTGSDTSQNGNVVTTTNYYYDKDYFIDHSDRLEKFITIEKAGETEKITMKNKLIGNCSWF
jgi:tetratricopeptide (TPR) repeat protein